MWKTVSVSWNGGSVEISHFDHSGQDWIVVSLVPSDKKAAASLLYEGPAEVSVP